MAVEGKISAVNAKIAEFGNIATSDDDNTAIGHLQTVQTHLSAVSGLLNARKRRRRSTESKKNISWLQLVT